MKKLGCLSRSNAPSAKAVEKCFSRFNLLAFIHYAARYQPIATLFKSYNNMPFLT
jgi:hypothetical protein